MSVCPTYLGRALRNQKIFERSQFAHDLADDDARFRGPEFDEGCVYYVRDYEADDRYLEGDVGIDINAGPFTRADAFYWKRNHEPPPGRKFVILTDRERARVDQEKQNKYSTMDIEEVDNGC